MPASVVEPSREWPASAQDIELARGFLRAASAGGRVALCCDRDVDGLTAALIIARLLSKLGNTDTPIFPVQRGENVHTNSLRERIQRARPEWLVVLDMGSRAEPIGQACPTLILDHHQPSGSPPDATLVSAFEYQPRASTSLLAYEVAAGLADMQLERWLALLGAAADYGFPLPFPELVDELRLHSRKAVTESIALLNAARRARPDGGNVALQVLAEAKNPRQIASGEVRGVELLRECRNEVRAELQRCSRVAPQISGNLAVLRCSSSVQVHPLVAQRWSTRLSDKIVVSANDGYVEGRVNFALRTRLSVNLVELLRGVRLMNPKGEWGNGHPEASGGSLDPASFEELLRALGVQA